MLTKYFIKYLTNLKSEVEIIEFINALSDYGFKTYSSLLRNYINNSFNPFYQKVDSYSNEWFISSSPQENPKHGEIWFDVRDLTPYIFVLNPPDWSKDVMGWYSLRPIYVWQYKAFAELVKFELYNSESTYIDIEISQKKVEFFNIERVNNFKEEELVRNIFQDEAKAYCTWFGKFLIGEKLICAEEMLDKALLREIIPSHFKIWDYSSLDNDPTTAIAFNLKTVSIEDYDDLLNIQNIEDRAVFGKFESDMYTGFSTFVKIDGIYKKSSGVVDPYIKLNNFCPSL